MEMDHRFDLNEYQVVRREYFAHSKEPIATFSACRFYVNAACLGKFPHDDTVLAMINREKRLLALTPCPESQREALLWCLRSADGKRKPRHVTCRLFFAMLCFLMNWDPGLRYQVLGRIVQDDGQRAALFDLSAAEAFRSEAKNTPRFPADWRGQFGPDYREHRQFVDASLVDGYTVYAIRDGTTPVPSLPDCHIETTAEQGETG